MSLVGGVSSARLALRWLLVGEFRAHPTRFLATAIAIAVGVALGFAVHLVNGTALASFGEAIRSVNGSADLMVRASSPLGFDEAVYPKVMAADGVKDVSPVVVLDAQILPPASEPSESGPGRRFSLLGLDVIRAANVTPSLVGTRSGGVGEGRGTLFEGRDLFLSRAALGASGASIGETVWIEANGQAVDLRVAGILPGVADDQAIGTMDIASAQWRFDQLGTLDRLDLKLADEAVARDALEALLPANAILDSSETQTTRGDALSRAYRVNLDMLALVALLTGGFLVYSAQSLSVTRRLRSFALLRTLGLEREGIVASIALEGLAIGVLGTVLGLLMGYGLAIAALNLLGGDLGAGYFSGTREHIVFQPKAAFVFFLLGLAAALVGSVFPALSASRAAPAAALKNTGDVLDPRDGVRIWPAILLLGAGILTTFLPPVADLPIFGYAAMALLLAGGVAGVPFLARALLSGLLRLRIARVSPMLAIRHVYGAPKEAAAALCGIVASTALMIAMATMVLSFRIAVDEWLGQTLASDLYVRAEAGTAFEPVVQDRLAGLAGVARIDFTKEVPMTIAPNRPAIGLIARSIDPGSEASSVQLIEEETDTQSELPPAWVSEPAARLYGWAPGDVINLPIGGEPARFTVAGVWRDYSRQQGAVTIRSVDYTRLVGDESRMAGAITLEPGADVEAAEAQLRTALPPALRTSVSFARPGDLRDYALALFDRSFAVTYVLEAVAILVGLAGVAATMSAQTIARVREFGMLRHLGVAKREIMEMLGIEGALLGTVGAIAGIALGLVLSQVLIHVINPQSFNWTMGTHVPITTILAVALALILAAAVTAVVSARRATHMNAVLAVREDW